MTYGWWKTLEHFCEPGSKPIATSSNLDRIIAHIHANTTSYRKQSAVADDSAGEWRLVRLVREDSARTPEPAQTRKYNKARDGGPRGELGDRPPTSEVDIDTIDLDEGSDQRFWMEARRESNRAALGRELFAERITYGPGSRPAFKRVSSVRPGDRVIHWWRQSLIGVSVVAAKPTSKNGEVQVDLRDFVRFPSPIFLDDLRRQTEAILAVYRDTRSDKRWSQFPFQIDHPDSTDARLHGAANTYFSPFPPTLLDSICGLSDQVSLAAAAVDEAIDDREQTGVSGPTREADPERRRKIELHAEGRAIEVLTAEGFTLVSRPGRPYDLNLTRNNEELHVEVKGSSVPVAEVFLTRNEVAHASEHKTTLIVVDRINVDLTDAGEYTCSGGDVRRWDAWTPKPNSLTPLQFKYTLPNE